MLMISGRSVNEAAYRSLLYLTNSIDTKNKAYSYKSDKGMVNALDNVMITVKSNHSRWLTLPGRHNSIIATIAEIMWVMSGSNDVTGWLNKFLKRAPLYCDDGIHWRAGYGARLFGHHQVQTVLERLKKSPATRQAVISIYDPAQDSNDGLRAYNSTRGVSDIKELDNTLDMCCNNILYFTVKDNKLNLHVTARGLDWAWGIWSINYQEFTFLQEMIAKILKYEVGDYNVYVNNLHLYTEVPVVTSQVKEILNNGYSGDQFNKLPRTLDMGMVSSQTEINHLFTDLIDALNNKHKWRNVLMHYYIDPDSELGDWCKLIECYFEKKELKTFSPVRINNRLLFRAVIRDHFNNDLVY